MRRGDDRLAVRVVAAVGVGHEEAGVERGDERTASAGRDRGGVGVRTAARDLAARVQRGLQKFRVHPRHADDVAGVDRGGSQRGLVDGGQPVRPGGRRVTTALRRRRAGSRWGRSLRGPGGAGRAATAGVVVLDFRLVNGAWGEGTADLGLMVRVPLVLGPDDDGRTRRARGTTPRARRAAELPSAGLVSAPPREMASQMRKTPKADAMTTRTPATPTVHSRLGPLLP